MGVDVNKDLLGLQREALWRAKEGGFFEEGVAVLDNFVFNHGHKGFNLSGKWAVVKGNRNERLFIRGGKDPYGIGGWKLTLDGYVESNGGGSGVISDNLSRAFDMGGWNVWVDDNFYNNLGSSPGNDGEGILCQTHGGTHWWSWAITHNKHEKGDGHGSYIGAWAANMFGALIAWNETPGWVGSSSRAGGAGFSDLAFAPNKASKISGPPEALRESPPGAPKPPTEVKAAVYQGDGVMLSWKDAGEGEIGYRVDRSLDGGKHWTVIAYRPPQLTGHELNPPAWADFLAPSGKPLVYRVVAVNGDDKDDGASAPTAPVTVPAPKR
jgi:hypothetical protein